MSRQNNIHSNVKTSFITQVKEPEIAPSAFIHPQSVVIGEVTIGDNVFIGPFAGIRGDEGVPIHINENSNVQDAAVLHAMETFENGKQIEENLREVNGKKYAIYIGSRVSLAHQCQIHGPAVVLDDSFVGMQALVFKSPIGRGCVIAPAAKVIGVDVPDELLVPPGLIITSSEQVRKLKKIQPENPFFGFNDKVVHVNTQLANNYSRAEK